jgi:hypothetical protein
VRGKDPNLESLTETVTLLGSLADEMVFLGGCATGLLLTDPGAPPIRTTLDVDVIVEVTSYFDYQKLGKKLQERGFREDTTPGAPLCRWRFGELILDVMPTSEDILGFGNRWYGPAIENATLLTLPAGDRIRLVSAPYFLATKIEAFDGRGKGDFLGSHDIEDIVAVLDGRREIVDEVKSADSYLQRYFAERFRRFLSTRSFMESLPGHLPPDQASQDRLPLLIERIKSIVGNIG